jgi:hypothetical protein
MAKIMALFLSLSLHAETWIAPAPIPPEALKKLAYLGIEYTFNTSFPPVEEAKPPIPHQKGVLFLTDFQQSPEMFQEWIELGTLLPKKILRHHLIELEAPCK